jgi:hypothetical protein
MSAIACPSTLYEFKRCPLAGKKTSCRVKVAFCGLTAATTPCTSVFGGFCRVTMTEMPMKPEAMAEATGAEATEYLQQ